jgi:hypothetical protein
MHIQVVNIDGLKYTRPLIDDLFRQTKEYRLRLIDQNSSEDGTKEYFNSFKTFPHIEIVMNDNNVDLNRLWNEFYFACDDSYLCFLNNDIRVASNFVEDTLAVFEKEPDVGVVIYSTNHPSYQRVTKLNYVILSEKISHGWAFTVRREDFIPIPVTLRVFGGDDFIFENMFRQKRRTAMILSSPIIHFRGRSRSYFKGDRNTELANLVALGYGRIPNRSRYTNLSPKYEKIIEE